MWEEWDLLGPKGLLVPEYWLTGAWDSRHGVGEGISGASNLTRGPPPVMQLPLPALLGTFHRFHSGRS